MADLIRYVQRRGGATVFGPLKDDGLRPIVAKLDRTEPNRWEIRDRDGKPVAWETSRVRALDWVKRNLIGAAR